MNETLEVLGQVAAFVEKHRTFVLVSAGVAMVVLSSMSFWLRRRLKGRADVLGRACDVAAIVIAIALSAEGMWEVATEKLQFDPVKAILLFAFAELAMARSARRARVKAEGGKAPGPYGVLVWGIALAAGVIAASNAPSIAELMVRLLAPVLVAGQWWADLVELLRERRGDAEQRSSWIWTPRLIGVHLGLVRPGKGDDLDEVFRRRNADKMVRVARRMRAAGPRRAARLAAKLQRLGESADDTAVAAAAERYRRGASIQQQVFGAVLVEPKSNLTQRPGDGDAADVTRSDAPNGAGADAPTDAPVPAAPRPPLPAMTRLVTPPDVVSRRTREVVMRRPVSAPPADRDAALAQAVDAVLTRGESIRGAARGADLPEATVRREVNKRRGLVAVNGHNHSEES